MAGAATYLTSEFVERRLTVLPNVPDTWNVDRSGHQFQLDLKMCQISALRFNFAWGNERTTAPRASSIIEAPSRILRIDISLNDLTILHRDWLEPFKNLRHFDVSLNQLKHLDGISMLSKLRYLNLSHNALRSLEGLPDSNVMLELRLAVNDIQDISNMPNMNNLKILDVSNNHVLSLDGLTSLPRLEELYAHRNDLRDILPVMGCRELRVLNAANNNITSFDTTVKVLNNLRKIQNISLHGNPIDREAHYQGDILRVSDTIMTLDNVTVKPVPRREQDHKRHASNLFSLKDAATAAFHDRMKIAKERLDDNVKFLQRRIVGLQHEHREFEAKLKADLEACLRYLDTLSEEEIGSQDKSSIGAVLNRKREPFRDPFPEERHRTPGSAGEYGTVKETDELLRCTYNELIKQGASAEGL